MLKLSTFIFSILLLHYLPVRAYQPQSLQPSKQLESLEAAAAAAENLFFEGRVDAAIDSYHLLQQQYAAAGYHNIALDLYEDIFAAIAQHPQKNLSQKINDMRTFRLQATDSRVEGLYQGGLAYAYLQQQQLDSMQVYYRQASAFFETAAQHKYQLTLNLYLAYELYYQEASQQAKDYIETAQKLIPSCTEKGLNIAEEILIVYNILTVVYTELSEYNKAIQSSLKRIRLLQKLKMPEKLAYEYNNLATTYSYIKDNNNALRYFRQALQLIEVDNPLAVRIIYNIGSNYMEMQKRDSAIIYFSQSLELLKNFDKTDEIQIDYLNNYHSLVDCYLLRNELDSALYYSKACRAIQQHFDYRKGFTAQGFAEIYYKQKKYVDAEKNILQAIEQLKKTYGTKSEYLAGAYRIYSKIAKAQQQYDNALYYLQEALEAVSIRFKDLNGCSNPPLKNVLNKGKLVEILQEKLDLMLLMQDKLSHHSSRFRPAQLYNCAKLAVEAFTELNRSLKDEGSKVNLLDNKALKLFEQALAMSVQLYEQTGDNIYLDAAFRFSEQSKSMLMSDTWHESDAVTAAVPQTLQQQEYDLRKQLMRTEKQRFDAGLDSNYTLMHQLDEACFAIKHQLDELNYTFESQYPNYHVIKYSNKSIGIKEVQQMLPSNSQFIEFFEGEDILYAFVLTKVSVDVHKVVIDQQLKTQVQQFVTAVSDIQAANERPAELHHKLCTSAHFLYRSLIAEYLDPSLKTLIIVPRWTAQLCAF